MLSTDRELKIQSSKTTGNRLDLCHKKHLHKYNSNVCFHIFVVCGDFRGYIYFLNNEYSTQGAPAGAR